MKKIMYNKGIGLVLCFCLFSLGALAKKAGIEKSKTIDKSFTVSSSTEIEVENKFGEMKVTNWDKNEVVLHVEIKVENSNEKKAQELLDKIKIEFNENDDKLTIETIIGQKGDKVKMNGNSSFSINYDLKIPTKNPLYVKTSFGPLVMDDRKGNTKIKFSFAAATIGRLDGEENELKFSFADPVVVSHINKGSLKLQHSKLELGSANEVEIKSEMSTIKSDALDKADLNLQFGSAEIKNINTLKLNSQMSSVNVAKLVLVGAIDANYGSVHIEEIPENLQKLNIKAEFSPIKIELAKDGYFETYARSKMGSLKLPAGSINLIKTDDSDGIQLNMNKEFKGWLGKKKDKKSIIEIENSFGDIKIIIID